MAFGISEIIKWGLARLRSAQRTAGVTGVLGETAAGAFLNGAGATVLTKSGTATTFPGVLSVLGGTVATNNPALDVAQTWSAAGQPFDGLRVSIINTASGTNAFPLNVYVGGVSIFSLRKDGYLTLGGGVAGAVFGQCGIGDAAPGIYRSYNNTGGYFAGAAADVSWVRGGSGIWEQRNGANAQTLRVFNTGDSTNGEWAQISWQSNTLIIGAAAAGSGTQRNLRLAAYSTEIWGAATYFATENGTISFGVLPRSNGVGTLTDASGADFGRLQFGGASSSYPSLKRSSATLQVRLADDSAFADFQARSLIANSVSRVIPVPVGSLPSASASGAGAEATVNDATSPAWGATVAGGGAVTVGVRSNGTNWIVF